MAGEVGKEATVQGLQGTMSGAVAGAGIGLSAVAVGAATGSVVPVIGTAIGAVVGAAVGVVSGMFTGSSKKKAKRYARLANQIQQQREANRDYEQFLQMIRQQRLARAATMSQAVSLGLEGSSAVSGAMSGQQSQTAHNINYLAEDKRLQELYYSYAKKAGIATSIAQDQTALFNAVSNTAMKVGEVLMSAAGKSGRGSGGDDTSEDNSQGSGVTGTLSMNPVLYY